MTTTQSSATAVSSTELLNALKYSGLHKDHVDELVKNITSFDGALRPVKVFPKGIPAVDSVVVQAVLPSSNLSALIQLLQSNARIDNVVIFPKGIPVPDVFVAEIGLR